MRDKHCGVCKYCEMMPVRNLEPKLRCGNTKSDDYHRTVYYYKSDCKYYKHYEIN